MEKGYIQVYTGEGKGKTTASLGLALRAVCAGKKVIILQFVKGMKCSEHVATQKLPGLKIEQYGRDCFIKKEPDQADLDMAAAGLCRLREVASSGIYDVVVADEFNVAVKLGLISLDAAMAVINGRSSGTELVLTGRDAHEDIIAAADLVTEMREIKHYYAQGVQARVGIEM